MKVAVFTTSYPRHPEDFEGRFVYDAVEQLRNRGIQVQVVAPGVYRDYGLGKEGRGVVGHLKRRPWVAPLLLASMIRALRRAARDADLVHAHWLAGAVVAAFARRPFVVTLHGSGSAGRLDDLHLARHVPRLVAFILRRAGVVICVSNALARAVRQAGAPRMVVIPNGIHLPESAAEESDPPHVLFAGRLSPEKGIDELIAATQGLNVVIVGDGPLRSRVPSTLGMVPHNELLRLYEEAAVVVCPSRSEGFALVCAEAMAHGRPVVATTVGGLPDMVVHEETGLLVEPGDVPALRAGLERLLADRELRHRYGSAARERIAALCSWDRVTDATLDAYREALAR
ncbi:MAG: glycosyltransferase family 4 protein [Gaiellaceae bacterium]